MDSSSQSPYSELLVALLEAPSKPVEQSEDAVYEVIPFKSVEHYRSIANKLTSLTLSHRNLCDIELILNGGFAPLTGFMNKADYESVLERMQLSDGTVWPIPITLDVDQRFADSVKSGQEIALHDANGLLVAILRVNDIWQADKKNEALAVYNTLDEQHAGVSNLFYQVKEFYISGELIQVTTPQHFDYRHLRFTPDELKAVFQQQGWEKIIAFHTDSPMHKPDRDLTIRAAKKAGAKLLIQPVMGVSQYANFNHHIRCYEHIMKTYPNDFALLSLLPLATRLAGPREALWQAIIRKNYGCTHFIIKPHHGSPTKNQNQYYSAYDAETLALTYQDDIGIEIVPFQEHMDSKKKSRYFPIFQFRKKTKLITFTGEELHDQLRNQKEIPEEFSYPEVIHELRKAYPSRLQQGFTVLLTGLPRSGKSTIASGLTLKLKELTGRQITLLDSREIRSQLTLGLGLSPKDQELSIERLGYVAREITKHNGIIICEMPMSSIKARNTLRKMVSQAGGFIEVHISTPISVCEKRDTKGVYGRTRGGQIISRSQNGGGFEAPISPEIDIDTSSLNPSDAIEMMVKEIRLLGFIE